MFLPLFVEIRKKTIFDKFCGHLEPKGVPRYCEEVECSNNNLHVQVLRPTIH